MLLGADGRASFPPLVEKIAELWRGGDAAADSSSLLSAAADVTATEHGSPVR